MSQSRSGASSEGCGSSASSLRMNSIKPWFIRSTSTLSTSSGPMKVLLQLLAVLAHEGNFPCWALVRSSAFADKDSMHLKAVMCLLAFVHTQVPFCESRSKPTKARVCVFAHSLAHAAASTAYCMPPACLPCACAWRPACMDDWRRLLGSLLGEKHACQPNRNQGRDLQNSLRSP